jgi:hypothetical protein
MLYTLWAKRKIETNIAYVIILVIVTLPTFTGCAGNYGSLRKNGEVNSIFKGYQVLADYNYYYSGPKGRPDAIMGIHREYRLQTTQWTPIDLTGDQLKKWVQWFDSHYGANTTYYPYGFQILDHSGNPVGIWYSIWNHTTVEVKENNQLIIFPPAKKSIHPFDTDGRDRRPMR